MLEGWNRESKVQLKWYGSYRIREKKKKEDLSGNGQDIKDAKGKADNVE